MLKLPEWIVLYIILITIIKHVIIVILIIKEVSGYESGQG